MPGPAQRNGLAGRSIVRQKEKKKRWGMDGQLGCSSKKSKVTKGRIGAVEEESDTVTAMAVWSERKRWGRESLRCDSYIFPSTVSEFGCFMLLACHLASGSSRDNDKTGRARSRAQT